MAQGPAWYDAYPKPRNESPAAVTRQELLGWLEIGQNSGVDFLLIDVRRTDHEVKRTLIPQLPQWFRTLTFHVKGGTIKGSINLPAQSLYHSLPTLLALCQNANIRTVIWYCGRLITTFLLWLSLTFFRHPGSCGGRGTRAAGWFQDLLDDRHVSGITSAILQGGVKGWARAGKAYTDLMDEYEPEKWPSEK